MNKETLFLKTMLNSNDEMITYYFRLHAIFCKSVVDYWLLD